MKTLSIILTISFFSLTTNLFAVGSQPDSVTVNSANEGLFMLKVDKDLFGGQVIISYSDGEVVSSMTIKRKRMVIDFDKVKYGSYTITLVKDGIEVEQFTYNKELVLSQVVR